jgi:segregation and condensation protein B
MKADEIQTCLNEMLQTAIPLADIMASLMQLSEKYTSENYAFQIYQIAGGYQFLTKPAYQASVGILLKQKSKKRLSTAALETLAVIAYKQPVTKTEIEQIRGVSCDYALQKLLEKELIIIKGKSETVGRPILYGTNQKFMEYFGINSLRDLPQPKDFATAENEIGEGSE